jgi:hypothetical protein
MTIPDYVTLGQLVEQLTRRPDARSADRTICRWRADLGPTPLKAASERS